MNRGKKATVNLIIINVFLEITQIVIMPKFTLKYISIQIASRLEIEFKRGWMNKTRCLIEIWITSIRSTYLVFFF